MIRFLQRITSTIVLTTSGTQAEPLLSSWHTATSGRYARIYDSLADMQSLNAVATWSEQETPAYAGVHEVCHSNEWVYIKTTGLGFHIMGPWYFDEAKTQDFGARPANTASIYRFPKTPIIPESKTATRAGTIGYFVDGIAMFDSGDTFSYDTSSAIDSHPTNDAQGDGVWNRDAYVNESVTFDNANAHQAMTTHHYHANPPALRHLLGDSVDYTPSTNVYTENFNGQHSPIIGWVQDGLPIYGPYGYDDPDPASTDTVVRRMISGYQKRDGSNGSTDLRVTGRTTLPEWVNRLDGRDRTLDATVHGPDVDTIIGGETYTLGRYFEDYAYKGDLGLTLGEDFDLNDYNVRFCRTPEFPQGTWAYFTCILEDGTPTFPYNIGTHFYGDPTGSSSSIDEDVDVTFVGGPSKSETPTAWTSEGDSLVITWSTLEGGSYRVETSEDLSSWDDSRPTFTATGDSEETEDTGILNAANRQFYRLNRTGLADYDDTEFGSSTGGPGGGGPGGGGGPPGGGPPQG